MRILQVVHGFPPAANGGTEVYARDLALALAKTCTDHVAVLTRHADPHARELSLRAFSTGPVQVFSVNNTFQSCESFEASYSHPAIEELAGDVLDTWKPDVIHIQHLTCLSTGIPRQAVKRGVPVVMTLNDYWLICHRGQLVDRDGQRCNGPGRDGCARCLPPGALAGSTSVRSGRWLRTMPVPGAASAVALMTRAIDAVTPRDRTCAATLARLRHMQSAAADVSLFLAPSDTLAAHFQAFGIPKDRLLRCNQGIALRSFDATARAGSRRLRLGFVGGLLPTKGANVLLDAIERLPPDSVVLDLLGNLGGYHGDTTFAEALTLSSFAKHLPHRCRWLRPISVGWRKWFATRSTGCCFRSEIRVRWPPRFNGCSTSQDSWTDSERASWGRYRSNRMRHGCERSMEGCSELTRLRVRAIKVIPGNGNPQPVAM